MRPILAWPGSAHRRALYQTTESERQAGLRRRQVGPAEHLDDAAEQGFPPQDADDQAGQGESIVRMGIGAFDYWWEPPSRREHAR